ncbi:MAG: hypothetical protein AABY83_15285 [Pseudomonadota bacterium]
MKYAPWMVGCLCVLMLSVARAVTVAETAAAATGTPAGGLSIADYIIKLEMMYQAMLKQLQELKSSNKALSETSEFIRSAARDYRAVKNFSPDTYIARAKRDIPDALGYGDLERLKSGTPDQKAEVIAGIMQRHTTVCAVISKDAAALRRKAAIESDADKKQQFLDDAVSLDDNAWMCQLRASADANLALAGSGTTQKQESQINAQSAAIYAALAAAAAQRDQRREAASKKAVVDQQNANANVGAAFKELAKERREGR